jgi:hypothetical protein
MEKIIVGFSKPSKNIKFPIVSWAIRLIERTPYSHVYIRWYSDSLERDIVYQASGTMVNFVGMNVFSEHAEPVHEFEIECSKETIKKTKQFAIDKAGYPYGVKQIVGILFVKIASLFGKKIKNPFADGGRTYVCSELVAEILKEKFGIKIEEDLDAAGPKYVCSAMTEASKTIPSIKKLF